ncbi:large conductance mechanosensitive channel protein MscL [Streptomyces sp. NPDC004787]|uniref:large conductance mechanosensitive channel protein MscL n=1 Tax=Streptomyces sp. NPDC004787 TaxID=3154291 RepID=UPI0033A495DD
MAPHTAHGTKGTLVAEKKESLLGGFKAFLMRGNVIDLAVAVVIGAAFTNIVNSVVKGIINPLVGAFGTKDLEGYSSCLKNPCKVVNGEMQGIQIQWGLVLSAVLSFLITAAVVYFLMVLPMAKILAKRAAHDKAKESVEETLEISELEVLKEIRDHLVSQRGPSTGSTAGSGAGGGTHSTS